MSKAIFLKVGSIKFRANKNVSDLMSNERLNRLIELFKRKIVVVVTT